MWPILEIGVEPNTPADREKLTVALRELVALDPTLGVHADQESGQTILCGASEEQLDQTITAIRQTHGVQAMIGQPQVAYRETIGRGAEITYVQKAQTGDSREFAEVTILFQPSEPNAGFKFSNWLEATDLSPPLADGVEKGLMEAKERGLLAGFPVIDLEAALVSARFHEIDSTPLAFELAARGAFRRLRNEGRPRLLEPIMQVEVTTPEDFIGDVIGDLTRRRGMIQGTDQRGDAHIIAADVPLSNMFGYANTLRSMSQGRADFSMRYDHYGRVPRPRGLDPDPDLFPPAAAMRA
jgi:elongation factor G